MSIATLFPASTAALVSQVVAALSGELSGAPSQAQRLLRLHTPLGPDVLLAERANITEALLHEAHTVQAGDAGLRITLDVLCTNVHLDLKTLMGQAAVLELLQADGGLRPWHAHITQAALLGSDGGLARYRLTLEPWLAFLSQRQDAWVFQNQTVMQIIDEVFEDYQSQGHLAPAWRWELADASVYPQRSLCTQYQETDLAFVQRLLAEEGLFAWWEHSAAPGGAGQGQHTLVIADHNPAFAPNAQPLARFTQSSAVLPQDSVHGLGRVARVHSAAVHMASADYRALSERPVSQSGQGNALLPHLLQADVPGAYNYVDAAHGERLALRQVQALDALRSRLSLRSTLRQAAPGTHWLLTEHPLHSGLNPADDQFITLATVHMARNNLRADIKAGLANLLGPVTFEAALGLGADLLGAAASSISLVDRDRDEDAGDADAADAPALPNQSPEPIHHCALLVQPLAVPVAPYAWATVPDSSGTLQAPDVRLRPRPRITGVQTALVVGLGDPVHTDRDHRVKVQFHWQRGPQGSHRLEHAAGANAPASDAAWSWVRVAERQSGANWGSVFTPRVGQEVLVGFTGGDIDRPVVLGSLYNGQGQPDAQGNAVSAGAAGAVGSANAWFPGSAAQGELQAHAHPQVHSGFKSQALDSSHTGLGGCNQLVLDDSPEANRIQLSSSSAATKLQLGHLLQQTDNQRLQARGHGIDLATSAWGAVRAAQGLLISAHAKPASTQGGAQMDSREPTSRLEQSQALLHTLAESAQAHHAKLASEPDVKGATADQTDKQLPAERGHHATLKSLAAVAEAGSGQADASSDGAEPAEGQTIPIQGGEGTVPAWDRPDLILAAPGGVASVTPAHHFISAGATSTWVAGQDLQHLAQGHHASAAKDGIVLYTYGKATNTAKPNTETGMALHAASGSVQTQTQSGATHLTADANVNVTSTSAQVSVGSPQKVLLAAGGAAITIQSGKISLTGPGSIELKAGMKNFTGPGSAGASVSLAGVGELKGCESALSDSAKAGASAL